MDPQNSQNPITYFGETDATGHYRINNVEPISLTDAYGFSEGYVYYHGHPVPIKAGMVTTYSFQIPRQTGLKPSRRHRFLTQHQVHCLNGGGCLVRRREL